MSLAQDLAAVAALQNSTVTGRRATMLQKFTSASAVAAAELAQNEGSLQKTAHGRLIRIAAGLGDWSVDQPWHGRELCQWDTRYSQWDKMTTVRFYGHIPQNFARLHMFSLSLEPTLTVEEVGLAAETYMLLLNMVRVEV